jgi:hypothetical protein
MDVDFSLASYPVDTGAPSLGIKRPGRKADHSPPSKCHSPVRLHGVVLS